MARGRYGSRVYPYTGQSIRNKKGEIVTPSIFGYKEGQIKVTALGRAKDTIRLTDVTSGEQHVISRYDYESLKEELRAGYFKNKDVFFKATYWRTREGQNAKSALAEQNFETMLNERYSDNPEFASKKTYIMQLFKGLSNAEKAEFFKNEDKLVRDLWKYDYALTSEEYPDMQDGSELDYLRKVLEKYFDHDSVKLKIIKHRTLTELLGGNLAQMIRYG